MYVKKGFLLASLLLLGSSYVPSVYAGTDSKIYPGSMCVRWSGTTNHGLSHSAIVNHSSTQSLRVDCPVVRDHTNKRIRSGWVNADRSVSCVLAYRFRKSNGAISGGDKRAHRATFSPAVVSFYHGSRFFSSVAWYYYSCTIPPKKRLYSYQVKENT